jgi:hypothetical protein
MGKLLGVADASKHATRRMLQRYPERANSQIATIVRSNLRAKKQRGRREFLPDAPDRCF